MRLTASGYFTPASRRPPRPTIWRASAAAAASALAGSTTLNDVASGACRPVPHLLAFDAFGHHRHLEVMGQRDRGVEWTIMAESLSSIIGMMNDWSILMPSSGSFCR